MSKCEVIVPWQYEGTDIEVRMNKLIEQCAGEKYRVARKVILDELDKEFKI